MTSEETTQRSPDAIPARLLLLELETRITTQSLHYRAGNEETAAISVHNLFGTTRKLLVEHPEAKGFELVALRLLNATLRPYTARWHGWMRIVDGVTDEQGMPVREFRGPQVRRQFRAELRRLTGALKPTYVEVLRALSGGGNAQPLLEALPALPTGDDHREQADLGSVPSEFRQEVDLKAAGDESLGKSIATEMQKAEHSYIQERRAVLSGKPSQDGPLAPGWTSGLALSGGGIRSATFCLGIVQMLHRKGLFRNFDYMSTVSGGGYVGTFLSAFLGHASDADDANKSSKEGDADGKPSKQHSATATDLANERLEKALGSPQGPAVEPAAIRHLRNSSKYLLNGGGWAKARIVGLLVTGFVASLIMLVTLPVMAAWLLVLADRLHYFDSGVAGGILAGVSIALLASWLLMFIVQRGAHGSPPKSKLAYLRAVVEQATLVLAVVAVALALVLLVPHAVEGYESLRRAVLSGGGGEKAGDADPRAGSLEWVLLGVSGLAPAALGWLTHKAKRMRAVVSIAFLLSGPLFFVLAFLVMASRLGLGAIDEDAQWGLFWPILITGVMVSWVWLFVNINTFSLHQYYRNRLCECYLAILGSQEQQLLLVRLLRRFMRGDAQSRGGITTLQHLPLRELGQNHAAPLHLINATLNVEASANKELRGRNGDFFLFSRAYCGSPLTGYLTTDKLVKADPHVDLGTAMAISGAAASTNMGWKTLRQFRFLMLLFNVRLGYWLQRPGVVSSFPPAFRGPGPRYFFREMVGNLHERGDYVNLSDGGHIENLAAYELLRRQTRFIVCADAGMEPGMECSDLMRLQRYASIDLGIEMHFDLADLQPLANGNSTAAAVLVKIDYAPPRDDPRTTSDQLGWMIYFKLAYTGSEPMHVQDYKRQNPAFPHQSTGDQIYDEAQFESYRALGEHAAGALFGSELEPAPDSIEHWFQILANNLLPDNDVAFPSARPQEAGADDGP